MNVLELFAGIGGLSLGLQRAGMTIVGHVEIDPYCQQVLAKNFPGVPQHDDVRTTPAWWQSQQRPRVDVVAGGFPCQPVSNTGLKRAQEDERWLWPAMADTIESVRPTWVIGENVSGLLHRGLDTVLGDLRRLGYRARAGYVTACAMGAPHPRRRLFILAHTDGFGCHGRAGQLGSSGRVEPANGAGWPVEPRVDRVAYGVPRGMDRRKALGNAVVPAVGEHIGRLIAGRQYAADMLGDAA